MTPMQLIRLLSKEISFATAKLGALRISKATTDRLAEYANQSPNNHREVCDFLYANRVASCIVHKSLLDHYPSRIPNTHDSLLKTSEMCVRNAGLLGD